jgi:hypothetical protein
MDSASTTYYIHCTSATSITRRQVTTESAWTSFMAHKRQTSSQKTSVWKLGASAKFVKDSENSQPCQACAITVCAPACSYVARQNTFSALTARRSRCEASQQQVFYKVSNSRAASVTLVQPGVGKYQLFP